MRRLHTVSTGLLFLLGLLHTALTPVLYGRLEPDSIWFAVTGIGILLLGALNRVAAREPWQDSVRRLARAANWSLAGFGVLAVIAVPEPQAFLVLGTALAGGVALSTRTSGGPPG